MTIILAPLFVVVAAADAFLAVMGIRVLFQHSLADWKAPRFVASVFGALSLLFLGIALYFFLKILRLG